MTLYLDIDGVLNNSTPESIANRYGEPYNNEVPYHKFCRVRDEVKTPSVIDKYLDHLHQLDIKLCLKLEEVLKTDPTFSDDFEIVVCSAWRKIFNNPKELSYLFYLKGCPIIASHITRNIIELKDETDINELKQKGEKYTTLNLINFNRADAEILYDLVTHEINSDKFFVLSDDCASIRSNIFKWFQERMF